MSTEATVVERAIAEILDASLPERLRDAIGPEKAREWVGEHLDYYAEEKARLPDEPLLPLCNWLAYDDWEEATFFVVMVLRADAIELFFGTGYWPAIRHFGEREAGDIAPAKWYGAWSSRFEVPCPPLVLGKAVVKAWLGRDWE